MRNASVAKANDPLGQLPMAIGEHLTARQLDVLALLCEGLPNKAIGRRLNISSATVKIHVAGILRALNVSSRLQAVIAACRLGLAPERVDAAAANWARDVAPRNPVVLRVVVDRDSVRCQPASASGRRLAVAGI